MDVVWLAEIKWDFLRTRKQQLIRRRPEDVRVLYLEPYVRGRENRYEVRDQDGISVATVPFLKAVPGGPVRALLDLGAARRLVDAWALRRTRRAMQMAGVPERPAVITSNVFAAPVAASILRSALVYDCNDAHSAFPGMPAWTQGRFEDTCRLADRVVVSARALGEAVSDIRGSTTGLAEIGNGVDFPLFDRARHALGPKPEAGVTVGYLGAIAPWFDFAALEAVARAHPEWTIALTGPVMQGADSALASLSSLPNVTVAPAVSHDQVPTVLHGFTVGVIPFRYDTLTRGVNPNKMYEYLAMGLPVAATRFSPEVEQFPDAVFAADDAAGFVGACERAVALATGPQAETFADQAATIAAATDWGEIAGRFWSVVAGAASRA
jgi:glycosyltransferase involved in cell wall biosynthesis